MPVSYTHLKAAGRITERAEKEKLLNKHKDLSLIHIWVIVAKNRRKGQALQAVLPQKSRLAF